MSSGGVGRTVGVLGISILSGGIGVFAAGALGLSGMAGSMLVGVAYMGGSFLGQMLFPAASAHNMPSSAGYPMQTVDRGTAVKVVYGTDRVAGNLVWMGPLTEHGASGGGKGGGDSEGQTMYRRSFLISVCEGPHGIPRIWKGKHEIDIALGTDNKTGIIGSLFGGVTQEVTVFNGDGVNEGLETLIGEDYSQYRHDCCVLFKNYDLGAGDTIPAFTFEVGPYVPPNYYVHTSRGLWIYDPDGENIDDSVGVTIPYMYKAQVDIAPDGSSMFMKANASAYSSAYYRASDGTEKDLMPYAITTHYSGSGLVNGWVQMAGQCEWNNVTGCCFDSTGGFAFVSVHICYENQAIDSSGYYLVYKINVNTGEVVWGGVGHEGLSGTVRIDRGGNIYVAVNRYAGVGSGAVVVSYRPDGRLNGPYNMFVGEAVLYDIWVDDDFVVYNALGEKHVGFLFGCGYEVGSSMGGSGDLNSHYCRWTKLSDPKDCTVGMSTSLHANGYSWDTGFNCVRTYNNIIYLSGTRQYNSKHHVIQTYNGWGELLAGYDTGAVSYSDPNQQPTAEGHSMDAQGRIALNMRGTMHILTAGTLTEIDSFACAKSPESRPTGAISAKPPQVDPFDENPADIILDLLTHRRYGAGMPAEYINGDSFSAIHTYCQENDLLISVTIGSSNALLDWIQFICSHFGGFLYWVGGELYLGAWRGEDPEFHLTRDHLVAGEGEAPVQVRKRKYSESFNHIELAWQNRDDIYGPASVSFRDDVDLRLSGKRRKNQISLSGIKRSALANKMGWRYLIDSMYRFSTYAFRIGSQDMLLHVGQVGLLTDGFRLSNQRIRLTSISEAKDGVGMDVEAVDDISTMYPDFTARTMQTTLRTPDPVITSGDMAEPSVTITEDAESETLVASIVPGNEYTGDYRIFTSWDGDTYTYHDKEIVEGITGGSSNSKGTLLSELPSAEATLWRGNESFTVDIGTLTDLRTDVTASQFFHGESLVQVGDEIIGYKTCVEQGTEGQWEVSELIRGMYGTTPVAHEIGEAFVTLDTDSTIPYADSDAGRTLYVKVVPTYHGATLGLSGVEATTYTIQGQSLRPYGAALLRLTSDETDGWDTTYSGDSITLYWNLPGQDGYNVGGQDGGGTWKWGDDTAELVPQNGVLWGSYVQDPYLVGVDLVFKDADGVILNTTNLGVVSTATISKATDLDGNNPAAIEVYPRYARRAIRAESITVDDGS